MSNGVQELAKNFIASSGYAASHFWIGAFFQKNRLTGNKQHLSSIA